MEISLETMTLGACSPAKDRQARAPAAAERISEAPELASRKVKRMPIRVRDGTPLYGPSLCETCSNAHVRQGYRATEKVVVCCVATPAQRIDYPIRECSEYCDRTKQNLWQMQKIAWLLAPRGPKRKAGFTPPAKKQEEEEEIEIILEEHS